MVPDQSAGPSDNSLGSLVTTAAQQTNLSGLNVILARIASSMQALGCIVWEEVPGFTVADNLSTARLFPLAQSFKDGRIWWKSDIPTVGSLTGLAILHPDQQPLDTPDVESDARTFTDDSFLKDIGPACTVAIAMDTEVRSAVTLYRLKGSRTFDETEKKNFLVQARVLPYLFRSLLDGVAFQVLQRLDVLIDDGAPGKRTKAAKTTQDRNSVLQEVAELLQESLRCSEVSFYVVSGAENSDCFSLAATTGEVLSPKPYYCIGESGLSGWVVTHRKPLRIMDLRMIQRDLGYLRRQYDGLSLTGPLQYAERPSGKPVRPVSFLAAPIISESRLLGVVQCVEVNEEPAYFSKREVKLVELAAQRVGQYLREWQYKLQMRAETESWRLVMKTFRKMNELVSTDTENVLDQAIDDYKNLLRGAESATLRWVDNQEAGPQVRALLDSLLKEKDSKAKELAGKELRILAETGYDVLLPRGVNRVLLAEVSCGEPFGVLEICGKEDVPFLPHSTALAELLGRQIGLYSYLDQKKKALRESLLRAQKQTRTQAQAFADLSHQVRSPILQAHRYSLQVLNASDLNDRIRRKLNAIRGLTAKGLNVASCVGLFADLAEGKKIVPNLSKMAVSLLVQGLIEAAMDNQMVFGPEKEVRFRVDETSFERVARYWIRVDLGLFMQCINCLLDNAGKYCYPKSDVIVSASVRELDLGTCEIAISVINQGITLSKEHADKCIERGWRSEYVKRELRDSGHGLGLWIVKEIMAAHSGDLEPVPTSRDKRTEFRLVLKSEGSY